MQHIYISKHLMFSNKLNSKSPSNPHNLTYTIPKNKDRNSNNSQDAPT